MKISRLEALTLLLCACFAAFALGWFLRGGSAGPVRIDIQRQTAAAQTAAPPSAGVPPEGADKPLPEGKINVNTASAEELQTLPGIGEKRAADIVDYRARNGPFRIPEDLTKVKGIGEGILEGLLDYITVGEETQ